MRPPSPSFPRRRWVAVSTATALLALAGATPAGASTGLVAPSLDPTTDNATTNVDPDLVLPTDTEVEAPAPDFVPYGVFGVYGQGARRVNGPNVLWGALDWAETATGPAAGVRVTMVREQDGWRFSTTTDAKGRYRVAVPDGTYGLMVTDPRLPNGTWTDPGMRGPYISEGMETWNGGRGPGQPGGMVIPKPRFSCTAASGKIVTGVEGWAPGADPGATACPYPANGLDPAAAQVAWDEVTGSYPETGRDGVTLSYMVPPEAPAPHVTGTAATSPTRTVIGVPQLPRTIRLKRRGTGSVVVRCPAGTTCAGTLRLTTPATGRSRSASRGATLASGTLRSGRTRVGLRMTRTGTRLVRRRTATVAVVWQPAGGSAATTATARLRVR